MPIPVKSAYSPPRTLVHCPSLDCENNFKKKCTASEIHIDSESRVTCFKPKV